jgi:hypothetical protein
MVDAVDEDDERAIEVPEQMWDFYDTELMKHFLTAASTYFKAYTVLVEKEENSRPEPGVVQLNAEPTEEELAEIDALRADQQTSLKQVAQHYSRIILHCSNFERSKEDERFFECLYYFACVVLKSGVRPQFWDHIERELGFVFRGQLFNINEYSGLTAAGPETSPAEPTSKLAAPQKTRPVGVGLPTNPRIMEREHKETTMRITDNLQLSSQLREEMDRKAFKQRNLAKTKNTSRPPAVSIGRSALRGAKKPKFSVHHALHARSPVISLLLPTAKAQQTDVALRYVVRLYLAYLLCTIAYSPLGLQETKKGPNKTDAVSPGARSHRPPEAWGHNIRGTVKPSSCSESARGKRPRSSAKNPGGGRSMSPQHTAHGAHRELVASYEGL